MDQPTGSPPSASTAASSEAGWKIPPELERRLGPGPLPLLGRLLAQSPDPEAALSALDRFVGEHEQGRAILAAEPGLLEPLLIIFSHSRFLSETLIHDPALLGWLAEARDDERARGPDEWAARLSAFVADTPRETGERARWLTRFKRREYLRIVIRDLSGLAWLAETTQELSALADAILARAHVWAWNDLVQRMGAPMGAELAVIALGKLGGNELNYSSDIDLLYIYSGEAGSEGAQREFFTRLAQLITEYVSMVTPEGAAYRVDLRLRPGGREGELALPLSRALDYYRTEARDWELQMLIRARACAGAAPLAERFLAAVQPKVYPAQPDPARVAAGVRSMRQRIHSELEHGRALRRRGPTLDVKLDAGGIRDIEFLCQYLQRLHAGADRWLRGGNTAIALQRLHDKRHLAGAEFQALSSGYWLLRSVEHRLQLHLGQQTHSLPAVAERVGSLARSLLAAEGGRLSGAAGDWLPAGLGENAVNSAADRIRLGEAFRAELERRMRAIRAIYLRYLGEAEVAAEPEPAPVPGAASAAAALGGAEPPWARRMVRQMPLTRHGRRQLQRLLRAAATIPSSETELERLAGPALPRLARALDASDWMADMLVRRPRLGRCFTSEGMPPEAPRPALPGRLSAPELAAQMSALRLASHEQRFAVIAAELEQAAPVSHTLAAMTQLAERALAGALELARLASGAEEVRLCVLGLGRLGLGELDLLSDLDLVFVSPPAQCEAAARLAARLIEVVTAYTRDGALYAVDARLRPGGGEGELVQTPESLADYFRTRADAWEAVSFLKARPVAGDAELGREALAALWSAWGERGQDVQALRQDLRALRDRMEREGTPGRWGLKTPAGGYYDADFILSWRALAAGPAAVPAGESLSALARRLAGTALSTDAAGELAASVELLRSADHALRVATGKAGRAIPAAGEAIDRAEQWLARLWPSPLPGTLAETVAAAQAKLRELYRGLM